VSRAIPIVYLIPNEPDPPDPPDIPSPMKTSSQGIAGKVPGAYKPALTITQDELATMKHNIEEWRTDPSAMLKWMQDRTMVHLQVLDQMAVKEVLGRSGPQTKSMAIRSFSKLSTDIVKAMQGAGVLPKGPKEPKKEGEGQ